MLKISLHLIQTFKSLPTTCKIICQNLKSIGCNIGTPIDRRSELFFALTAAAV